MIKNYNFNIAEEEKKQILNLHESRTKRHYLINEQSDMPNPTFAQAKEFVDKYNEAIKKYPNSPALKDPAYMNKVQIFMNKVAEGETSTKPTQSNNNSFSDYVRQAQKLLGVTDDGKFGPKTLKALTDKLGVLTSLTTSAQEKTPETPKTLETTKTPGTTETTKTPGTPETPKTPGTPETPKTPGTTETPKTPGTTETPKTPETSKSKYFGDDNF
jgi:hypothetical protein